MSAPFSVAPPGLSAILLTPSRGLRPWLNSAAAPQLAEFSRRIIPEKILHHAWLPILRSITIRLITSRAAWRAYLTEVPQEMTILVGAVLALNEVMEC